VERVQELFFKAILDGTPTPAVRLNPDLPHKLEEIISKCLEKDRNLRYQHASDIRTDLQRLKRDTETGNSAATLLVSPVRRKRNLLLGAGVSGVEQAIEHGADGGGGRFADTVRLR
jgi:serine/threonine protein kinase